MSGSGKEEGKALMRPTLAATKIPENGHEPLDDEVERLGPRPPFSERKC
jgi:hypothetical protein